QYNNVGALGGSWTHSVSAGVVPKADNPHKHGVMGNQAHYFRPIMGVFTFGSLCEFDAARRNSFWGD
ncbi:MAG: hypothetical protein N3G20_01365, partial [Verrucomicrobiae bacterium]|nr:hypothetical protein [Verrucomicrobiae bacterium]